MENVIILGSGRSGTSMVAGTLAGAGYFMGDDLVQARASNAKGFYEDRGINRLNEDILIASGPSHQPMPPPTNAPGWGLERRQLWLAQVPLGTAIRGTEPINQRIAQACARVPFCYKDPRFCYTLPVWRPYLRRARFVCVFRHPLATVRSILKECEAAAYLKNVTLSCEQGLELWSLMYRHVLEIHRHQGDWLFLHYDQALTDAGLDRLSGFVGGSVDRSFPDRGLNRSPAQGTVPEAVGGVYAQLCELAGFDDKS